MALWGRMGFIWRQPFRVHPEQVITPVQCPLTSSDIQIFLKAVAGIWSRTEAQPSSISSPLRLDQWGCRGARWFRSGSALGPGSRGRGREGGRGRGGGGRWQGGKGGEWVRERGAGGLDITDDEAAQLVAFLKALTAEPEAPTHAMH